MEVLQKKEQRTRCIYRLIMCKGGGNVSPWAILIKLMDVANYCSNIFNCISALKRIKPEFHSLCLRTIRGVHSGALEQCRHTAVESTLTYPSQLSQVKTGAGISSWKRMSVTSPCI